MTRKEVVRMAIEAGIPIETDWAGRPSTLVIKDGGVYLRGVDDLFRFAELVAAAEREACAQVCRDEIASAAWTDNSYENACLDCAEAIRARGEK